MLPLVQTHHVVHPPLDPFGPAQDNFRFDYPYLRQPRLSRPAEAHYPFRSAGSLSIHGAQPIETLHRIATSFAHNHGHAHAANLEYSLRRKTPSGTIDNGYDGSMSHLASGPPPLKHMILPVANKMYPAAGVDRISDSSSISGLQRSVAPGCWPPSSPSQLNGVASAYEGLNQGSLSSKGWGTAPMDGTVEGTAADRTMQQQYLPRTGWHASCSLQPMLAHGYRQFPPPMYSPSTYQQSTRWGEGAPSYEAPGHMTNSYPSQNAVVDSALALPPSAIQYGLLSTPALNQCHAFRLPPTNQPLDDGFSRHSHSFSTQYATQRRLEALSLNGAGGSLADPNSPVPFKERILQDAHKAYSDLLVYLSNTRKAQHGRSTSGPRSTRMIVYPKPPKSLNNSKPSRARIPAAYLPPNPNVNHHCEACAGPRLGMDSRPADLHQAVIAGYDGIGRAHHALGAGFLNSPSGLRRKSFSGKTQGPLQGVSTPLLAAKACLDVLEKVCQGSEYHWIDGMLLAGCLQYGLERYEEALLWFERIMSLEASHVEAISNIAATLYCLDRHAEAEQYWMRAVKMRPSYLEAVEHLVGLLCSNHRNQEAVTIINNVQQALRVRDSSHFRDSVSDSPSDGSTSSAGTLCDTAEAFALESGKADSPDQYFSKTVDVSNRAGYGSSGYAIPGSENGRMLLLIHAKGNMLYALKEVDCAAQAFEEAVLIGVGRQLKSIHNLISTIKTELAPRALESLPPGKTQAHLSSPLLLPPEKAKRTAQLVFSSTSGHLVGLQHVPEGRHWKLVVSTTSNSLLSLAKIFQDGMSKGGPARGLVRQPAGVGDVLALYYLSMSLQESPSTANNVGILMASLQQSSVQRACHPEDMVASTVSGIAPGSGLALALAYYNHGLTLDPKHVHLHTNMGSLLKDIGQLDLAIAMYEQAVACDGTFDIALTNLANAVKDRGRVKEAIGYYKRAVSSNPNFAEAVCGLSTALNSVCDWRGRGGVLLSGGRFDRWHVDDDGMVQDALVHGRGNGLMQRVVDIVARQLREASKWGCGILQDAVCLQLGSQFEDAGATFADACLDLRGEMLHWMGRPWEGSRILRLVERSTRAAMRCWYLDQYARGMPRAAGYPRPRLPGCLSVPTAPTVLPFHTFTCPLTARDIRSISQRNAQRISCSTLRATWLPPTVYKPPAPPGPHLKVGYVSSDFNNHPLAHLMQSVFGFHDGKRVKAFCYATTASDGSIHRQQIEREAPVFLDVSSWSSEKVVDQIVQDGIHILVNLNGYTRGARNEVFAARPAPIQMSFMGFAGTLGAEWCDYLLADAIAIPQSTLRPHRGNVSLTDVFRDELDAESEDWVYSENIIFCRDTFFCCDHAQSADGADDRALSWEEEQRRRWKMRKELFPNLPDQTIILGNFNQLYKIDPSTFRSWLRILQGVPNAVLWLLRFPELGESNLRRTARAWATEDVARRIVFTDVAPKQQHISRARVCDLVLDTPECNAHTTAADVLWSSTPLMTLPRYDYKMCSRMAASILRGALPRGQEGERAAKELIATDDAEYEQLAVRLASTLRYRTAEGYGEGYGRLFELRKLLWESKWTCALFDTRRWVRDLEEAYEEAWRRWVNGESGDIYL